MTSVAVDSTSRAFEPHADALGHVGQDAWYAIWTRSHCEQLVSDQLAAKGFEMFLPTASIWSTRRGVKRRADVPLFPGYLFVHHAMDKHAYVEVIKARGVVRVLGERWDRLEAVADDVVTAIRQMTQSGEFVHCQPQWPAGTRVRVTGGPLAGLRGTFVRERSSKGLFVVAIDLLQRSVAVEVDGGLVEAL